MAKFWAVVLLAISFVLDFGLPSSVVAECVIDHYKHHSAERKFAWNPGLMSKGGIPNRSEACATLRRRQYSVGP